MHLAVKGHPLHTRALAVSLAERAGGKLDATGYVLDLRKRGFVPVAADLQTSGIVHNMQVTGVVDPVARVLESIAAAQTAVAFEPSAVSGGESCRDPIGRVADLAGTVLDASFSPSASTVFGGPRGCSHILTLLHLFGSTIAWALERGREIHPLGVRRRVGERLFRRDVVLDGHEADGGALQVAVQLTDVHFAPAEPVVRPMERFAEELEVRLLADVDLPAFSLRGIKGATRRRSLSDLDEAAWESLDGRLAALVGAPLFGGFAPQLFEHLGDAAQERPVLDALLMLCPALIQVVAAMSESWPSDAARSASLMGTGGLPDSCYMWRREGALNQVLKGELESGVLKPRR